MSKFPKILRTSYVHGPLQISTTLVLPSWEVKAWRNLSLLHCRINVAEITVGKFESKSSLGNNSDPSAPPSQHFLQRRSSIWLSRSL